ncbi:MAG: chemotaxis protein, partial [Desulfobacterales bacterium]|nr:chemotaxis protein [Desulfobacterales bacterium]
GTTLVHGTASGFNEVVESADKVGKLLGDMAMASHEQARGIDQVNRAVGEMDKVVQQNAASAQELAAGVAMFKTGNDS